MATILLLVLGGLVQQARSQDTPIDPVTAYWISLKFNATSALAAYMRSHRGKTDDEITQAIRKGFKNLHADKVPTPEAAIEVVLSLDASDQAPSEDRLASYRVVDLVRSGKGLDDFAPMPAYIWVVRQVDSELRMINQYWVSAPTGQVYQAFPNSDREASVSAKAIRNAMAAAWERASQEEPLDPLGEAVVFGNLMLQDAANRAAQTEDMPSSDPLAQELAEAKIGSTRDAYVHVLHYINQNKLSFEANASIKSTALVRLGVDVPGLASKGNLVWIATKLFPAFGGTQYVYLIDAKSGRVYSLLDDGVHHAAK